MPLIIYISFILLFLYVLLIGAYIYGFQKIKRFEISKTKFNLKEKKYLSVIIPFKNEEEKLNQLIKNLKSQTLEAKYFEVILINDNSSDKSYKTASEEITNIDNFCLLNLTTEKSGKKTAIKKGIEASTTSLIVTSDADCIHQEKWLENILNYYIIHKPKMIIAPVIMTGSSFFQKLQSLEFFSLTASTAGAAGIKRPIMCNGANLIYEKEIYNEFEDALNMQEVSGDDIFLMHNIKKKYQNKIHYLKTNDAVVYTESEKSIKSFFKQRIRWASKSKSYKDMDTIISAILVFGINILLTTFIFLSFFESNFLNYLFIFWSIKFSVDIFLLIIAGKHFKKFPNIILLFLVSLVYPFYIIITATISFFVKNVIWKAK